MIPKKAYYKAELQDAQDRLASCGLRLKTCELQLRFWQEQARNMENQVAMWQKMYSAALETMRNVSVTPPDLERQLALAAAALNSTGGGVADLIRAVALAATKDREVMLALAPELAPLLERIKELPSLPEPQIVSGAQAERTAIRVK